MTITETESVPGPEDVNNGNNENSSTIFNTRIEPEISLEWTDLKIEIKYCGSDIPEEDLEYVELFPNLSEKVLSSACLLEKKLEYRRRQKQKDQNSNRPGSRTSHTLTDVLEQNESVNHKRRSDGGSEFMSPEPEDEDDRKSQKSEDLDLPDNIDQLIDTKMLITLEDGSKKCHICGREFFDTTRMKRHLLSHSDKKPYKCNLCGWGFHQKTNMERHLASHTNEGEGHHCSYCNNWFTTKSVLSLHIREAHNGKITTKPKYEDDDTDFSPYAEKKVLKDVFAEDCDLSNLKCNICGKTFVKKTNLKHHLMLHRGEKPWKCHICGWRFVQKCNLKKHIETHNTGMYHCPHCDVKFASKGAVNGHLALAHADQATPYFNTDTTSNHEEDEEAEIPAPNQIKTETPLPSNNWWKPTEDKTVESKTVVPQQIQAGSITITPKTVNISPKTQTSATPKLEQILKTFSCSNCPKVFSSKKDLDNHTLVHNAGMKPFACPVCGLRFHLLHNMKRHLQTHEESGDIEVGTASGLLEAVEATATKVQSNVTTVNTAKTNVTVTTNAAGHMKCNFCNKWFSEQAALQRHMEVHSANRPYSCPICGWRFKQMHNMKRHLLTHSGAKPYSCDFCDKSYTDNYSLKQHVAKIHPDIASSLPHMMITPRNKNKPTTITPKKDEEGFKSMVNEMTASQKAAALQAYQTSLRMQQEEDLPFGVEAVTYEEEDEDMDDTGLDPTDFMEEGNLEIDTDEEPGEAEGDTIVMDVDPVVREEEEEENEGDHIEIEQPPVTEEVIDQGGEADDEKDSEKEKDSE